MKRDGNRATKKVTSMFNTTHNTVVIMQFQAQSMVRVATNYNPLYLLGEYTSNNSPFNRVFIYSNIYGRLSMTRVLLFAGYLVLFFAGFVLCLFFAGQIATGGRSADLEEQMACINVPSQLSQPHFLAVQRALGTMFEEEVTKDVLSAGQKEREVEITKNSFCDGVHSCSHSEVCS